MACGDPPPMYWNTAGMMPPLSSTLACGCHVGMWHSITPPPQCAHHASIAAGWPELTPTGISDADVERIAQRVAELLKPAAESKVDTRAPIIFGDPFAERP